MAQRRDHIQYTLRSRFATFVDSGKESLKFNARLGYDGGRSAQDDC